VIKKNLDWLGLLIIKKRKAHLKYSVGGNNYSLPYNIDTFYNYQFDRVYENKGYGDKVMEAY
jgi:hypothetical protein